MTFKKLGALSFSILLSLTSQTYANDDVAEPNLDVQPIQTTSTNQRVSTLSAEIEDLMNRRYQSVYNRPYSLTENEVDYTLIKAQTWTVAGASLIGMGVLALMPESTTNWKDSENSNYFEKWWNHVKEGPVQDNDDGFLNYVTHPYWGAAYYMAARSSGASATNSFLYSFLISTFFWEYGLEAFAEVPSAQDLWITPVIGSILGEGFYLSKRHILENDYELLGSSILGHTAVWFMDPLSETASWFMEEEKSTKVTMFSYPSIGYEGDVTYNMTLNVVF